MSNKETIHIVQAGASGPVAEKFRAIVAKPNFPFELEAIATASQPELVGKLLGETALKAPAALEHVPIIRLDDAVASTKAPAVFSSLQNEAAAEYEDLLANGRVLATNAGEHRMRDDVALFNAYIGGPQLEELFAEDRKGYIIANGNCTSIVLSLPLAALHNHIGVESLTVETLQGWSGAGKDKVPEGQQDEIAKITGDEKTKIETEPNKFLGSMNEHTDINITAKPNRGPWVKGHHELIEARLARSTSVDEVEGLWLGMRAPEALRGVKYGKNSPKRKPIKLVSNPLLHSLGTSSLEQPKTLPMRVRTRLIKVDENVVTFEIAGDNLVLGAAGASAMNLVYAKEMGYLS